MLAVDFFVSLGITRSGGIAAISLDTIETGAGADPVASIIVSGICFNVVSLYFTSSESHYLIMSKRLV